MTFKLWKWGTYFICPWFSCGAEFSESANRWRDEFVRWQWGRLMIAWRLR